MTKKTNLPVANEKNIVDNVLSKVTQFKETGELVLPKDYSAENALKSAYLILSQTLDKQKNPVLTSCSQVSIANTLLDMVVQGLSPMKNQCYFIPYGNTLQLSRSYLGSVAVARRVGLKEIVANVIYKDDAFSYEINPKNGRMNILEHSQVLENIDLTKIRGAYAITTLDDGTSTVTVMTMAQIKTSWLQGYAKGNSGAHNNFTDEMCKKTVINRACKVIINSSTDVILNANSNSSTDENEPKSKSVEQEKANTTELEIKAPEPVIEPVITNKKAVPVPTTKADF